MENIEILEILEMEITDELKTLLDKYEVYYISKFKRECENIFEIYK